jgi:hypothetical protein
MKLILKQIPVPDAGLIHETSLEDSRRPVLLEQQERALFALYTEDGQMLPCQVSTTMHSEAGDGMPRLTVTFNVNGRDLIVEGHSA